MIGWQWLCKRYINVIVIVCVEVDGSRSRVSAGSSVGSANRSDQRWRANDFLRRYLVKVGVVSEVVLRCDIATVFVRFGRMVGPLVAESLTVTGNVVQ